MRIAAILIIGGLLVAGIHARFRDLGDQVLGGDEMHALIVAQDHGIAEILTHHQPNDNSIPLTLWARLLLDTVGLSELRFRLPIALSALLLLMTPLLFLRVLPLATVLIALAMFATSPIMIYYAVVARPYAPAALLVTLALAGWQRWCATQSRGASWCMAACAALAVYFHLFSAFAVLGLSAATVAAVRWRLVSARQAIHAMVVAAVVLVALLLPGVGGLVGVNAGKVGAARWIPRRVLDAWMMLSGFSPGAALAYPPLMLAGACAIWRTARPLALALILMVTAQVAGIVLTEPAQDSVAWARYLFPVWPAALVLAAAGLPAMLALARRTLDSRWGRAVLAAVVLAAAWVLLHDHPRLVDAVVITIWPLALPFAAAVVERVVVAIARIPDGTTWSAAATGLAFVLVAYASSPALILRPGHHSLMSSPRSLLPDHGSATGLPRAYRTILDGPSAGRCLLEYPAVDHWSTLAAPYITYQSLHRLPIKLCTDRGFERRGFALRNTLRVEDAGAIARCGATYLVAHRDLAQEAGRPARQSPGDAALERRSLALFRDRYGPPVFRDDLIEVYKLH